MICPACKCNQKFTIESVEKRVIQTTYALSKCGSCRRPEYQHIDEAYNYTVSSQVTPESICECRSCSYAGKLMEFIADDKLMPSIEIEEPKAKV